MRISDWSSDVCSSDLATGWACDRDRPHLRCLMIFQHPSQREGRGEAGGADRHRLAQAQTIGLADDRIGSNACKFSIATIEHFANVATCDQPRITGSVALVAAGLDVSGEIDARHFPVRLEDASFARDRKCILVVDARPCTEKSE